MRVVFQRFEDERVPVPGKKGVVTVVPGSDRWVDGPSLAVHRSVTVNLRTMVPELEVDGVVVAKGWAPGEYDEHVESWLFKDKPYDRFEVRSR